MKYDNIINLPLLQHYDEKLKDWAIKKFGGNTSIQFITSADLPAHGELNVLYVTEDSLKIWDGFNYVTLSGDSSNNEDTWGDF